MKTKNLKKHSLVRIVWVDSNYAQGWRHEHDNTAEVPEIVTVGYVTHSNASVIEVASSVGAADGDKSNPLSIPICSVVKIERLGALRDHK